MRPAASHRRGATRGPRAGAGRRYGSDALRRGYFAPLIAAGGELRWFSPKRLLHRNFRNHRKLLRVDGKAVIGGLNIADTYDGDGLEAGWRDFAVRVDGPVVDALAKSFARMWDLSVFSRRQFRRFWRRSPPLVAGACGAGAPRHIGRHPATRSRRSCLRPVPRLHRRPSAVHAAVGRAARAATVPATEPSGSVVSSVQRRPAPGR